MNLSAYFARDPEIYFLNAGTQSRTPTSVLEWMRRARDKSELNPTKAMVESFPALWEAQKIMAGFLGASPHDIFFRNNITSAFNDFLFALPIPKGSEILVPNLEYGAVAELARWRAREESLKFRRCSFPLKLDCSEEELVAMAVAALRPETKVFIMSHVVTGTGGVLPIAAIAAAMRSRGVWVLVDGAHAVGALPVDVAELADIDFYGGNFHKWFMGPAGTGFGWVNPRWAGKLDWKFGGWSSFEVHGSYGTFGDGNVETARRLIPGTIDPIPFLGLPKVLEFWQTHGVEKLRSHQQSLRDLAGTLAEELGWERTCTQPGPRLGPLVSFRRPKLWGDAVSFGLATRIYKECHVQLALPQVGENALVRLSPAVYGTREEVEGAMVALAKFSP
ncbi:MAG: aminotransferase class V-fold PLP-dependent enzyme [Bdellovibrionota bacterium]